MQCTNVSWPGNPVASQSCLHGLPEGPDIKHDDMDAGKRPERMSAVFQLVKILAGLEKKPVALYDSIIRKSSRHVWDQT